MNIVRYHPFNDLRSLQNEVNRVFSGAFTQGDRDESIVRGSWNPSVDIFENADQIVLEAELPGLKRDEFDLTVENNVITLRGERRFEKNEQTDDYHRVERSYGSFSRSFTLPQTVATEEATAEYENGVLRVSLPKRETVKARKIEIKGGGTNSVKANPAESAPAIDVKAEAAKN